MSARAEGWLLPGLPGLAGPLPDGGLELIELPGGRAHRAEGRFGEELRRALEGGGEGEALRALPLEHPLRRALASLQGRPALPMSAAASLRLGSFSVLFLELTSRCNLRCVHCYAEAGPTAEAALARPLAEALLDEAAAMGFARVQLTGGEPLLCGFLPELVGRAQGLGLTCEIFTNGQLLEGALLDELAALGPGLAFSLYAARPELHDAITATPGSHARTVAAIRAAVARGLAVRVAIIAMAENAAALGETLAFARDLGVSRARVGASAGVGRGRLFEGPLVPFDDEEPCPFGEAQGRLCVAADRRVLPCIFNRDRPLGRAGERGLAEIVARPELTPSGRSSVEELLALRTKLPCLECQLTALALGRLGQR